MVLVDQWFSPLYKFTGTFYNKFTNVEIKVILSYLIKILHNRHVMELGVLNMLTKTIGGYSFAQCESKTSSFGTKAGGKV